MATGEEVDAEKLCKLFLCHVITVVECMVTSTIFRKSILCVCLSVHPSVRLSRPLGYL